MTNKEAAAYFASLTPDAEASIYFANGDTGTVEVEVLDCQEDLDNIDLEKFDKIQWKGEIDPKKPLIYQQW